MIRKFRDFFNKKIEDPEQVEETQEELDEKLFESIDTIDYNTFTRVIEKGANINISISDRTGRLNHVISPLIKIIYSWRGSDRDQFKFLKFLFEHKVNLFGYIGYGPHKYDIDIYDSINALVSKEYRERVIGCLLENYPDYMREREFKKDVNKYNL
jgi:hypothetical protein